MESLSASLKGSTLRTISTPLRVLFTCFLGAIGIGYIAALFYLFLVT